MEKQQAHKQWAFAHGKKENFSKDASRQMGLLGWHPAQGRQGFSLMEQQLQAGKAEEEKAPKPVSWQGKRCMPESVRLTKCC